MGHILWRLKMTAVDTSSMKLLKSLVARAPCKCSMIHQGPVQAVKPPGCPDRAGCQWQCLRYSHPQSPSPSLHRPRCILVMRHFTSSAGHFEHLWRATKHGREIAMCVVIEGVGSTTLPWWHIWKISQASRPEQAAPDLLPVHTEILAAQRLHAHVDALQPFQRCARILSVHLTRAIHHKRPRENSAE